MKDTKRGAGILLHISSLPSAFGIGDLGTEAKKFADFLHRSGQKYWQILPLNPTEEGQGHSPYSSISSKAGNTLFISPELLVNEGLMDVTDIEQYLLPKESKTDFAEAERVKAEIFEKAWRSFQDGKGHNSDEEFKNFCKKEAYWLDDFTLYMLLKQQTGCKPWFEWADEYKFRDKHALQKLLSENKEQAEKIQWLQFLFAAQWNELKKYCNTIGIQFFGDIPFYVSYDSADVWANRELFSLDKQGNMIGASGVPPDAFTDDGQLWGMPVFLWDVHKKSHYDWWIGRLKKNMELFDIVRLDHFRAFADFWEVAASEKTARNGEWKQSPGADFFDAVKKALGELPFIAEDLGEINDAVYELRDQFAFPGMKVLQFAFGYEMPKSIHIPHNYSENFVVYTGTHDNNTVKGWYRHEGSRHHHQLGQYLGKQVSEDNIHLEMVRLAYSSVANIAMVPMQDVLGLDEAARMNTPASGEKNWRWRLQDNQTTYETERQLREWTTLFNR